MTADPLNQRVVRLAGVLGNKNVAGAAQVTRRLAQCAARQKEFVSKRRLSIDQDDVETMFKMQILQTIIEKQGVYFPFVDGKTTAFDAIFVHQHYDVLEIAREHVGLVAGGKRVEQQRFSVGNDTRRINI